MNRAAKMTFVGSIILNVLLLGFCGRPIAAPLRPQRHAPATHGTSHQRPARSVATAAARTISAAARAPRIRFSSKCARLRTRRFKLLGAESFDEAALDRQEAKINDLRTEMSKQLSQSVKLAIKDLSPEERRRFAQMLRRPPPPKPKLNY